MVAAICILHTILTMMRSKLHKISPFRGDTRLLLGGPLCSGRLGPKLLTGLGGGA